MSKSGNSRLTNRILVWIRDGVSVVEAVELLILRLLGFVALVYELIRGFVHGK